MTSYPNQIADGVTWTIIFRVNKSHQGFSKFTHDLIKTENLFT